MGHFKLDGILALFTNAQFHDVGPFHSFAFFAHADLQNPNGLRQHLQVQNVLCTDVNDLIGSHTCSSSLLLPVSFLDEGEGRSPSVAAVVASLLPPPPLPWSYPRRRTLPVSVLARWISIEKKGHMFNYHHYQCTTTITTTTTPSPPPPHHHHHPITTTTPPPPHHHHHPITTTTTPSPPPPHHYHHHHPITTTTPSPPPPHHPFTTTTPPSPPTPQHHRHHRHHHHRISIVVTVSPCLAFRIATRMLPTYP